MGVGLFSLDLRRYGSKSRIYLVLYRQLYTKSLFTAGSHCLCGLEEHGDLIQCTQCQLWCHYYCVGIKRKLRNNWKCPYCTGKSNFKVSNSWNLLELMAPHTYFFSLYAYLINHHISPSVKHIKISHTIHDKIKRKIHY